MPDLKTQKAKGVQWLQRELGYSELRVPETRFVTDAERLEYYATRSTYPVFARPCPVTPRHGFVESRLVHNADEMRQVWKEAREADSDAEMMLMEPVDAIASAILTPTMASIGPGNDGATGGRDGTLNLKLLYVDMPKPADLIPPDSVPYAELVYAPKRSYAVQWRSGPVVDGATVAGGNLIPRDTIVQTVIRAHMLSPLELEEMCKIYAGSEGVIVWQAGGNPISHAAVHARLNNLPIVFDRDAPAIGTRLTATLGTQPAMCEAAFRSELQRPQSAMPLPALMPPAYLWAMHQGPGLCETDAGARFVARSAMFIWRYAATACIGEARHSRHTRNGKARRRAPHRHEIYERALSRAATSEYLRNTLKAARRSFAREHEFAGGFGGKAWTGCADAALRLYEALSECANGSGSLQAVIGAAHVVINVAHNNGYFLNKFAASQTFDAVAKGNWQITAESLREVYALHTEAATGGKVKWPLLRNRESNAEREAKLDCRVQWNLRNDGTVLHVQCGKLHKYKSANLPLAAISNADRAFILSITAEKAAKFASFHGGSVRYWRDALPESVMNLITLNLMESNPS